MKIDKKGVDVLNTPSLNKGTAFTQEERDALELNGLLPSRISTIEQQIERSYLNFRSRGTPLEKYDSLLGLLSRNENLFYQFGLRYAKEILPIIYTPTVGEAAIRYSRIYFQQKGLYLSYMLKDELEEIFSRYPVDEIDVIVVTDGERILGLGDLGLGGAPIPVGKLALYTLFGGIHPSRGLAITLDVGTNNKELLADPLYLGLPHERITGQAYDEFLSQFIKAVKKRYPKVLLQWEDFGKQNARRLLSRYRSEICSFNDDIQGTAAVTLGGLLAAVHVAKQKLSEQRVAILGAGSAGTGIADTIVAAMQQEGLTQDEARRRIYLIDIDGLLHFASKSVTEEQRPYLQPREAFENKTLNLEHVSLAQVVDNFQPTILIGVSAQGGAFTKPIIEKMATYAKRPIIFPLSNPTSKAECTPDEAITWTKGAALIATGSPFDPVVYQGKTYEIGQCNNVYIFPGVGLGAIATKSTQITDSMFFAAAYMLAESSPALKDPTASLFPAIEDVRKISRQIALAVGSKACEENVANIAPADIESLIDATVWDPKYPTYD